MNIILGDRVRDTITGFEGVAIARTEWLHGCFRVTIQPEKRDREGKTIAHETFDEPQLETIKKAVAKIGSRKTGGPRPEPNRGR